MSHHALGENENKVWGLLSKTVGVWGYLTFFIGSRVVQEECRMPLVAIGFRICKSSDSR